MRGWRWLGWGFSIALWLSTLVYAVTGVGLVGRSEPSPGADLSRYVSEYLAYRRSVFVWEQVENWSLAVALVLLAGLGWAWATAGRPPDELAPRLFGLALVAGAVVSAAVQIVYLGGLERVLAASRVAAIDPVPLGTMVDVIGRVDDYVENFGFLLVASGLCGVTLIAPNPRDRRVTAVSVLLALCLLVIVVTSFAQTPANEIVLLLVGAVVAPAWSFAVVARVRACVP